MATRQVRTNKRVKVHELCEDTFIERIRKMRALNCNPADIGIDNLVWRKFSSGTASNMRCRSAGE